MCRLKLHLTSFVNDGISLDSLWKERTFFMAVFLNEALHLTDAVPRYTNHAYVTFVEWLQKNRFLIWVKGSEWCWHVCRCVILVSIVLLHHDEVDLSFWYYVRVDPICVTPEFGHVWHDIIYQRKSELKPSSSRRCEFPLHHCSHLFPHGDLNRNNEAWSIIYILGLSSLESE